MNLHGHTKIELTDVDTGQTDVYESDNLVTNALQWMTNEMSTLRTNVLSVINDTKEDVHVKALTGGLMLFDTQIEENPEIIYPPAGNKMVGCGSAITYTGSNTMAGSYNNEESGEIENGWKHVWDFSTNQSNGTISCACLTTKAGGKATAGCYIYDSGYVCGTVSAPTGDYYEFRSGRFKIPPYNSNYPCSYLELGYANLYIDGTRERILRAQDARSIESMYGSASTDIKSRSIYYKKSITIDILRFRTDSVSLFDENVYKTYGSELIDTVTVQMPQGLKEKLPSEDEILSSNKHFSPYHGASEGYIYIALFVPTENNKYTVPNGAKIYIWKIDVSDFSSSFSEVTNSTGREILWAHGGVVVPEFASISKGYLFVSDTNYHVICIKTEDGTYSELKFPDETPVTSSNIRRYSYFFNGKFYRFIDTGRGFIYDPETDETRFYNFGPHTYNYSEIGEIREVFGKKICVFSDTRNYSEYLIYLSNPAMLITINNLSESVTKTASQTMKVTYTLTRED